MCASTHHELAGKSLLCEAVALAQSGEEPAHALVLIQTGIALERLLDQPPQLLRLTHRRKAIDIYPCSCTFIAAEGRERLLLVLVFTFMLSISSLGKNRSSPTSFLMEEGQTTTIIQSCFYQM